MSVPDKRCQGRVAELLSSSTEGASGDIPAKGQLVCGGGGFKIKRRALQDCVASARQQDKTTGPSGDSDSDPVDVVKGARKHPPKVPHMEARWIRASCLPAPNICPPAAAGTMVFLCAACCKKYL